MQCFATDLQGRQNFTGFRATTQRSRSQLLWWRRAVCVCRQTKLLLPGTGKVMPTLLYICSKTLHIFHSICSRWLPSPSSPTNNPHPDIQSSSIRWAPGLVKFVPAVAYLICLNLPAAFSQPGARHIGEPCTPLICKVMNAATPLCPIFPLFGDKIQTE